MEDVVSLSDESPVTAPACAKEQAHVVRIWCAFVINERNAGGQRTYPIRQPVMDNGFERELTTKTRFLASGIAAMLSCRPS
jgi:hypothetical protein